MKKRNICTFWDGAWDIQPLNSRKTLRFRHQEEQRRSKLEKIVAKIKAFVFYTSHTLYFMYLWIMYMCVLFCFFFFCGGLGVSTLRILQ